MPHETEKTAEVRAWLMRAKDDLRAGDAAMGVSPPVVSVALFLAQQAAEKAMKGFLTWHDCVFRKTHNLVEIGELCVSIDPSLGPILRQAAGLTVYAWRFRYPGEPNKPSFEEGKSALALAREVLSEIVSRLPNNQPP
jgi:HEPN domain-containing protein